MELSKHNSRRLTITALAPVLVISALIATGAAWAQTDAGKPAVDPMMETLMRVATPGEPHAKLAQSVGVYRMVLRSWMDPSNPEPAVSEGTVVREALLGGRVIRETARSEFDGMPFEGMGLSGYDNDTGKYWATWNDTMSTGIYICWGTADAKGVITYYGEYKDPFTGGMKKVRSVVTPVENGAHFEWNETGSDGVERKTMEIDYTRQ